MYRPFLRYLWQRLVESECQQAAAALTYTSLFALVPIMTVGYALLSFMPALQDLSLSVQDMVFSNFLPETAYQVQDYLGQFSEQAKSLTLPGVIMLMITALLMLRTIEGAFNRIWDIQQGRKGLSSFLLYWAVLSLGPVLAGAGFMVSTYLLSLSFLGDIQLGDMQQSLALPAIAPAVPFILTTLALWLVYTAVPNCRVPWRHAFYGAVIAGLGFELAKKIFALAVFNSSYTLIYGAFAMAPLFLLWIYLSWMIVLAGAVLVRSLSMYQLDIASQASPVVQALSTLYLFWQHQQRGEPVKPSAILRGESMSILLRHHYIRATDEGDFILGRDLHAVTLWDICQLFGARYTDMPSKTDPASWLGETCRLFHITAGHSAQTLAVPLATLFALSDNTKS